MASMNRVILAGNLTRDCELSYTPSKTAVGKFGLAVNRKWRDQAGATKEEVTFIDVTAFGKQAETIKQYLAKGDPLLLEGRLHFSQWQAKASGQNRSKLDVVLERFSFLPKAAKSEPQGHREPEDAGDSGPPDDSIPF